MRIFWLEVVSTIAKTGNRQITAKILNRKPESIQQIIRRTEMQLGITFFHRIPWLNQNRDRLWDIADNRARIIIGHIDAILYDMMMAEETAFIVRRQKPDPHARYLLRTRDIERVLALNGNSIMLTSLILKTGKTPIDKSLKKVEQWLGINLYSDLSSGHEKIKVLTGGGELVFPRLAKIHSYYEEILELTEEKK